MSHPDSLLYTRSNPLSPAVRAMWSGQTPSTRRGNWGERAQGYGAVAAVPAARMAPLLLALLRPPTCSPVVVELPRSLSSASGTSPFLGVSLLHFPTPRCQPACTSPLLGVSLLALPRFLTWASYCAKCHSVLLTATLSAPSPQSGLTDNEVWRGLRIAPGNSCPGPGGLCSIRPPPTGHSDLDVDANYTALTPQPRLSSPSCAHPIALSERHASPLCRSSLGSAGHRPVISKSSIAPPPSSLRYRV